jgi:hypothetical protein
LNGGPSHTLTNVLHFYHKLAIARSLNLFVFLPFGLGFSFSILWGRWTSDHPKEDFAKFAYKLDRKVNFFLEPHLIFVTCKNLWSKCGDSQFRYRWIEKQFSFGELTIFLWHARTYGLNVAIQKIERKIIFFGTVPYFDDKLEHMV